MKKRKFFFALILAVLIFVVGLLLAVGEYQNYVTLKNHFIDCIPGDEYIRQENRLIQFMMNYLMLAIGGSLILFSSIYHGLHFRGDSSILIKLSNLFGIIIVFVVNFVVDYNGYWIVLAVFPILLTWDSILIFSRELFDDIKARKTKA